MRHQSQVPRLQTDSDYSKRLPIALSGDLLRRLRPLMTCSVRMAVEGSRVAERRMPVWCGVRRSLRGLR